MGVKGGEVPGFGRRPGGLPRPRQRRFRPATLLPRASHELQAELLEIALLLGIVTGLSVD